MTLQPSAGPGRAYSLTDGADGMWTDSGMEPVTGKEPWPNTTAAAPPDFASPAWGIADFIWVYTPSVVVIGVVSNVFCVLVLQRSKMKLHPIVQIVLAVCLSDTLFLLCLFVLWLPSVGVEIYSVVMACQFLTLLTQVTNFLATWLVALMTVERFITICDCRWVRCLRHGQDQYGRLRTGDKSRCTVIKIRMTIIAVLIVAIVVYVNIAITMDVTRYGGKVICHRKPDRALQALTALDVVFNVLLPYSLIALLTLLTCKRSVNFYFSRKRAITRRGLASYRRQYGLLCPKNEMRVTKTAVLWCIVYVVLTAPIQAMRILQSTRSLFNLHTQISRIEQFWLQVFLCGYHLSFATSFAVLLATHGGFRQAVRCVGADYCVCRAKETSTLGLNVVTFPLEFSSTLARVNETTLGL